MELKNKKSSKKNSNQKDVKSIVFWVMIAMTAMYFYFMSQTLADKSLKLKYTDFYNKLKLKQIVSAEKSGNIISGSLADGSKFNAYVEEFDQDITKDLRENVSSFNIVPPKTFLVNLLYSIIPMLIFIAFLWFVVYRNMAAGGGKVLSFGKSRAKLSKDKGKITFNDVAGVEESKEELKEIIDFLKEPKKFQKLGGKIPKGVLLMGPPGTGKTLLAKAVAGEADVPFYSLSGSDFVEMFVGVGASRVRDLFEQAKKSAVANDKGCIIFIDEIDAVGRQRFSGIGGGHDEREQTLNALLVEMDGFDTKEGVILIAATNRPDVLDSALLRPGRFDRQVFLDRPDIIGREAILNVHVKKIKLAKDVELSVIARQTPGFSGADLANLVNEAALLAARNNLKAVTMKEIEAATERVSTGIERRSRVISEEEKKIIAYHESGHAIVAALIPEADPIHKVTIIPRAFSLGHVRLLPEKDKYLTSKKEFLGRIMVALGGRITEQLMLNEITTGAQQDLEVATAIAHSMVCMYGMSENLGYMTFGKSERQLFLGRDLVRERDFSEETSIKIDNEVKRIIDECYVKAEEIIKQHNKEVEQLANLLLEKEVATGAVVTQILEGTYVPESKVVNAGKEVDVTIDDDKEKD